MAKMNDERRREAEAERETILLKANRMRSWSELLDTVHVPADVGAALATGRPELLKLVRPRALDEADCAQLYNLLAVLIETNQALISHAQELATRAANITTSIKGLTRMAFSVENYANFRHNQDEDEGED